MNFLLLFKAELKRSLLMMKRYPIETVTSVVVLYMFFMIFFLAGKMVGGTSPSSPIVLGKTMGGLILGYVMWFFAIIAITEMSWGISQEAQAGTLEQVYMTSFGPVAVFLARFLADLLPNLIIITILLFLLMVSTGIYLSFPLFSTLLVVGLTILGLYGFGFILGGMALIFKRIGQVAQVLQFVFLFLAMTPVEKLPSSIQIFAQTLPLTQGVKVMRLVILEHRALSQLQMLKEIAILIINSFGYLVLGILVYLWMDRIARNKGLLSHY
ncbi:MAG: ABC transporter permease [Candidatus Edwardsbacteria bacterium]